MPTNTRSDGAAAPPSSPSIYVDLMVSNERRATVSIRRLDAATYGYMITRGNNPAQQGTITSSGRDPLEVLRLALNDYFAEMVRPPPERAIND